MSVLGKELLLALEEATRKGLVQVRPSKDNVAKEDRVPLPEDAKKGEE